MLYFLIIRTMKTHRIYTSLALFSSTSSGICREAWSHLPILGLFIISGFPVLHGCESLHFQDSSFTEAVHIAPVKVAVHNHQEQLEGLDIFIFNDDDLQRLDSYQHETSPDPDEIKIFSQEGEKLLMACANTHHSLEDWMRIRSASALDDYKVDIEEETWEYPSMSCAMRLNAQNDTSVQERLEMSRISSEITLRSIVCDFKGRPYEGERLKNVKIYLTNVSATCPIWKECSHPERIINHRRYCDEDMARMKDTRLLSAEISAEIGKEPHLADVHLRCYPNMSAAESPGSAYTRLVIQGDLEGQTWYWPININRSTTGVGEGIRRNMNYIYDIIITRKGSADPDTAISTGSITINMNIEGWRGKENCQVVF